MAFAVVAERVEVTKREAYWGELMLVLVLVLDFAALIEDDNEVAGAGAGVELELEDGVAVVDGSVFFALAAPVAAPERQLLTPGRGACTSLCKFIFLPCPLLRKPKVSNSVPSLTCSVKSNCVASALLIFSIF